ncbi:hypothetical protein SAMN04487898_11528 [Pedobacter sp. ok626]|nr:hypothetical protein SAMN04487898_11528 [Pedobacter sp. ok626]
MQPDNGSGEQGCSEDAHDFSCNSAEFKNQSFPLNIRINRRELMICSKIGSSSTYHMAIKNLLNFRYITYLPSYNPYQGSCIKLLYS